MWGWQAKSTWKTGFDAHEGSYFGWWGGSVGGGSDGCGGSVCDIFFWKAVFVTDRCEVLRDGFGLVGGDIFDLGGGFVALGVETGGWFGVGERGCC